MPKLERQTLYALMREQNGQRMWAYAARDGDWVWQPKLSSAMLFDAAEEAQRYIGYGHDPDYGMDGATVVPIEMIARPPLS